MKTLLLFVLAAPLLRGYFGDAASSVQTPADAPHAVVEQVALKRQPAGHWQAIAKVKSMTHRGSIPRWTHRCYATPKQAVDAAVDDCEKYNHTACYGEPYVADRCDR